MKTKNILLLSLIGTVGIGVYYMGKNTILKKLQQKGLITLNSDGKFVLTDKGSQNIIEVIDENGNVTYIENKASSSAFDYNNPEYHAPDNYWLSDVAINNGEVKPSVVKSAIEGVKSIFGLGGK